METLAATASARVQRPRHPERTVLDRALAHRFERFLIASEFGLVLGSLRDYGLALSYAGVVLGLAALVAYIAGVLSTAETDWGKLSNPKTLAITSLLFAGSHISAVTSRTDYGLPRSRPDPC